MKGTEQDLSPETSLATQSRQDLKQSPELIDGCSLTKLSLGSVVELRWLTIDALDTAWRGRETAFSSDSGEPLDLVLRAEASARSAAAPAVSTRRRLALPSATALDRSTWELPAADSVVIVALTPELLEDSARMVVVSLAPRRSHGGAWQLIVTLVLSDGLLHRACATAMQLRLAMSDHDGSAIGFARLELRCGVPTADGLLDRVGEQMVQLTPQTVDLRLSFVQLTSVDERHVVDAVLEISVTGQSASRTIRSRPWKLPPRGEIAMEWLDAAVLRVDDALTQAIRFVLYHHRTKERAQVLAEGLVLVSEIHNVGDAHRQLCVELTAPSAPKRRGSRDAGAGAFRWGELIVTASKSGSRQDPSEATKPSAAALLGEGGYVASLADTRGALEVELIDATITSSSSSNSEFSLDIQMNVTPGKWTAVASGATTTPTVEGTRHGTRRIDFKSECFKAPLHWTVKERLIPSLICAFTVKERMQDQPTQRTHAIMQLAKPRAGGGDGSSDKAPVTLTGSEIVHLSVLVAYPSEWTTAQMCVRLLDDKEHDRPTTRMLTLGFRMRLISHQGLPSSAPVLMPTPIDLGLWSGGQLCVSQVRAGGGFLKARLPHDIFVLELECRDVISRPSASICAGSVPGKTALAWTRSMHCELPPAAAPPIISMKLFKMSSELFDAASDANILDALHARGQLVGTVSVPLPEIVLRDRHLVSFTLPLGTSSSSSSQKSASDWPIKKCGTLSFDVQFIENKKNQAANRDEVRATWLLQRIVWTAIPSALAVSISQNRCFGLVSEVSVLGGETLNDEVWRHETPKLIFAEDNNASPVEFVADHTVRITDRVVQKLIRAGTKCVMVVKLFCHDGQAAQTALAQAVIPIRGGWPVFSSQEKDKWHKVYASRHRTGNPEALGEIQLSVVAEERENSALMTHDANKVEGWLYLHVEEMVAAVGSVGSVGPAAKDEKKQAYLEIQHSRSKKPQRSKPRWAIDGSWQWGSDAVFVFPWSASSVVGEPANSFSMVLVIGDDYRTVIADKLDLALYMEISQSSAAPPTSDGWLDDWIFSPDGGAQARIRIQYIAAVTGTLQLTIDRLEGLCDATAYQAPVRQVFVRCGTSLNSAGATSSTVDMPLAASYSTKWNMLVGTTLALPVSTAALSRAVPTVHLQVLGASIGVPDICLAEGLIPLGRILSPHSSENMRRSQWITLHAKHNMRQRVAIACVRAQFQDNSRGIQSKQSTSSEPSSYFKSHEDWSHASSSVLVLWKKLFYRLDADKNGRIDIAEFKELFLNHADVFQESADGELLLQILLKPNESIPECTAPTVDMRAVQRLFEEMDRNGDKTILWFEYVDFMQERIRVFEPRQEDSGVVPMCPTAEVREAAMTSNDAEVPLRELRRKRREDPLTAHTCSTTSNGDSSDQTSMQQRASVRQLRASYRDRGSKIHSEEVANAFREENAKLSASLESTKTLLELEQQKSTRLQEELRVLRLANHQLQMQQERDALERRTRAQFMEEAIQSHEQTLHDRASTRSKLTTASIVLQSKVRTRLEQKKFQALKMQRWNAALRVQCAYRCSISWRKREVLQEAERQKKKTLAAAITLQRFVRFHVHRKERQLLIQARHLSAITLQTYVRRMLAMRLRARQTSGATVLQCWHRCCLAMAQAKQLRHATTRLRQWMRGQVCQRRWRVVRRYVRRVQRWWRHKTQVRWEYLSQLEAAMRIQAVWRGKQQREKWRLAGRLAPNRSGLLTDQAMAEDAEMAGNASSSEANDPLDSALAKDDAALAQESETSRDAPSMSSASDGGELEDRFGHRGGFQRECAVVATDHVSEIEDGEGASPSDGLLNGDESLPREHFEETDDADDDASASAVYAHSPGSVADVVAFGAVAERRCAPNEPVPPDASTDWTNNTVSTGHGRGDQLKPAEYALVSRETDVDGGVRMLMLELIGTIAETVSRKAIQADQTLQTTLTNENHGGISESLALIADMIDAVEAAGRADVDASSSILCGDDESVYVSLDQKAILSGVRDANRPESGTVEGEAATENHLPVGGGELSDALNDMSNENRSVQHEQSGGSTGEHLEAAETTTSNQIGATTQDITPVDNEDKRPHLHGDGSDQQQHPCGSALAVMEQLIAGGENDPQVREAPGGDAVLTIDSEGRFPAGDAIDPKAPDATLTEEHAVFAVATLCGADRDQPGESSKMPVEPFEPGDEVHVQPSGEEDTGKGHGMDGAQTDEGAVDVGDSDGDCASSAGLLIEQYSAARIENTDQDLDDSSLAHPSETIFSAESTEGDDTELEQADSSAESDDLLLLDATAVTQLPPTKCNSNDDDDDGDGGSGQTLSKSVLPTERADSDQKLLVDLEQLDHSSTTQTIEQVADAITTTLD